MAKAPKKIPSQPQSKTKVVGVRLDPRLRYLTELGARKQRRSISSFIEWAIEESLGSVTLEEGSKESTTVADEASALWDVDDADRFAKLALRYPDLLTHEEQVLWKLVRENGYLWRGRCESGIWKWLVKESTLNFDRLRENWSIFNAVAKGVEDFSKLPTWPEDDPSMMAGLESEFDADIPY